MYYLELVLCFFFVKFDDIFLKLETFLVLLLIV